MDIPFILKQCGGDLIFWYGLFLLQTVNRDHLLLFCLGTGTQAEPTSPTCFVVTGIESTAR